jgi:putative ABC transport system substrate-binding protein
MPALPQLEMIRNFVPKLKKLGVLYNPSEVNSVSYLEHVKKAAAAIGIDLVMAPLNNTSEAATATTSLMGKVDAIYFPNDNTAMAAVGAIVTVALKDKIPVFANDSASVEKGALAALAYNRYEMGRQTAVVVMQLLQGKHPEDIPVVQETPKEVVLNMKTLEKLQLAEPVLADTVRKIY